MKVGVGRKGRGMDATLINGGRVGVFLGTVAHGSSGGNGKSKTGE